MIRNLIEDDRFRLSGNEGPLLRFSVEDGERFGDGEVRHEDGGFGGKVGVYRNSEGETVVYLRCVSSPFVLDSF